MLAQYSQRTAVSTYWVIQMPNIRFGDRTINAVAIECRPSEMQAKDIIVLGDNLFQINTIQNHCPDWDSKTEFTMYVLKDATGLEFSSRNLSGKRLVYRPLYLLRK